MDYQKINALIDTLEILKVGSSKDIYPMYAQYVRSQDGILSTCNDDVYASLYFELPFDGCVNIYILQNVLKSINRSDSKITFNVKDDKLLVSCGTYKTKLNIIESDILGFPTMKIEDNLEQDKNAISLIGNDLYNKIRFASNFLGHDIYNYLVVDYIGICATDTTRLYIWEHDLFLDKDIKIMIDKKIISFLNKTATIGVGEYNNIIVERDDGYAIFTIDIGQYPVDRIREYIEDKIKLADNKIINAAILSDCINKITPILYGETESFIKFYNEDNEFTISAISSINGITKLTYPSLSDVFTETVVDVNRIKNIPFDYDIYIPKKESDFILLKNDSNSIILILGIS